MSGLPLEIITLLFSTIIGGVMSIWGQSIKASQERNKMYIAALTEEAKIVHSAREYGLREHTMLLQLQTLQLVRTQVKST